MIFHKEHFKDAVLRNLKMSYGKTIEDAKEYQIFNSVSKALMEEIIDDWDKTTKLYDEGRKAYYLSAEYLMGRALGNNLISLGIRKEVKEVLREFNIDLNRIEEIEEDAGLGNGGLGRLAACFIDSAATMNIPLVGYGIRYSHGLFKQKFMDGFQEEEADNWLKYGDPWSVRKEDEQVIVEFKDMKVRAIPYDTPIIAYGSKNINTLRLWAAEPINDFDFNLFNDQKYVEALEEKNTAEDISRVLYPNDSTDSGKMLRIKQQYFMCSSSLKDIIRKYKVRYGYNFSKFHIVNSIQLNDTHPVLAIPELIRILVDEEGINFREALKIAQKTFAYTNHTILAEALEKWNNEYLEDLIPRVLEIIKLIDKEFRKELKKKLYDKEEIEELAIISKEVTRMANLAIYCGYSINGVAELHTEILKNQELKDWYKLYPEKFNNKTNGITPRRWIRYANEELSSLITELLGSEEWVLDLSKLKELEKFRDDEKVLNRFIEIKKNKKKDLAEYIKKVEGIDINPDSLFDIQIKRLHEYKRQLLNAFYILDHYFTLKENLDVDFVPRTFIFGAKAFPGYIRAKGIVKFINEIAKLVNNDKDVNNKMKVIFVTNYRVSYAEKLFPAADLSQQISTAGKEASGTGNMKFMVNGSPTLGTYDGANVEIVREAGEENNFIFGLRVEDIEELREDYSPEEYYETVPGLKRVVDTLIDGTFSDGRKGYFKDIYDSLLEEDYYLLFADFENYREAQMKVDKSYKNKLEWAKKCWLNICNSGVFSSDRTILQYADEIWKVNKKTNK
ncbi:MULTISPECIES: glycogen/starch/alpha-glucan phosphorylase [unclassified Clostridium]|uniref:glycogen/starch/alpha-glucan phosphorylase n=1 Tax=unclassified Clostridium TaxID=2614128 RepID=UPI001EEF514E|nr:MULTISPECIES: glycogen/starch/alpha-glucan phosphorylase [unclassified Clostridium]